MSSEWNALKRAAARELEDTEHAARLADAQARQAETARLGTKTLVSEEYAALVASFHSKLLSRRLVEVGAQKFTFTPPRDSLFASWRERVVELVLVGNVGLSWSRAGEYGPVSSYSRALLFGAGIRPTITAHHSSTDPLPLRFYTAARQSSEPVRGPTDMVAETERYGQNPEILVTCLKKGLAKWAAQHWPDLELDLSPMTRDH